MSTYQVTSSGSPIVNIQYTRDALGRITQKAETIGGVTAMTSYSYDAAGRLADVTVNGTLTAHEYDENGNRLSVTRPSGTVSGTTDAQDRLLTYGAFTYTYTASGELQTATEGGNTTTYAHDPLGNLLSVTLPTGTQVEYVIDGQNRRVGKNVNGILTQGFLAQRELKPLLQQVFLAPDHRTALRRGRALIARFQARYPSAMECLEKDLEECLTYLCFPVEHRKRIRRTSWSGRSARPAGGRR